MKTQQVCKDFLRMKKGQTFDAIQASNAMDAEWGIRVDWHEMSYALSRLLECAEANYAGGGADRMTRYIIN